MIIILSILIAMALLTIVLNVGIKDFKNLREIVEDEELAKSVKKFPSNTEICKQTLEKLNKEDVKVEEDDSSKTSVYMVFKNKIVIGKANVITRIQTVIHECIHSTQDKRLLKFNVIFANINNLYLLIISVLSLFNRISYNTATICLWILALMQIILYAVRSFLETDAMTRAEFITQDYIEKTNYVSKEEKEKIIQVYKDVNKVGIKSYNYVLLMKALIRLLIYAIVMNMMVNLL
jgi:hypothetical protein